MQIISYDNYEFRSCCTIIPTGTNCFYGYGVVKPEMTETVIQNETHSSTKFCCYSVTFSANVNIDCQITKVDLHATGSYHKGLHALEYLHI